MANAKADEVDNIYPIVDRTEKDEAVLAWAVEIAKNAREAGLKGVKAETVYQYLSRPETHEQFNAEAERLKQFPAGHPAVEGAKERLISETADKAVRFSQSLTAMQRLADIEAARQPAVQQDAAPGFDIGG